MDTTTWIILVVVVLLLVALVAWLVVRNRKARQVRDRFGPEYDHAVDEYGSERRARAHLSEVAERRDAAQIKSLGPAARERYLARWQQIQADFVERPGEAVDAADAMVAEIMDERGYPGHDFTSRAELMAADHPEIVERYRAAHEARRRHHDSGDVATTEELRRAIQHYHELVTLLVEDGRQPGHRADVRPDAEHPDAVNPPVEEPRPVHPDDRPVNPDDEGHPPVPRA
ncbi:hypothetical protein HJG43_03160 [Kineosporiaceae bacterium SCSIO 59966]|nr:hypothetical protein HJG43_03160 [Kineosporiaceae bacterium SCSIO 59966]